MQKAIPAPKRLKPGFYVEVCDRGTRSGILVCSIGEKEMLATARAYEKNKFVIVLGEYKEGKWVSSKKK